MANELNCPSCGRLCSCSDVRALGLAMLARCPGCGHSWPVNSKRTKAVPPSPPKPAIVNVDPDGDAWLKTGRGSRRLLTQAEFLELVSHGETLVIRK